MPLEEFGNLVIWLFHTLLLHNLINLAIRFFFKRNRHLYLYYFLFSLQKGCEDPFYRLKILSQVNGSVKFVLNRSMAI